MLLASRSSRDFSTGTPVSGSLEMQEIDPLTNDAWDAGVTRCAGHSVFHRSAWARVLAECYGHQPRYLRFLASGVEVALVPLMEVTSRLTGCRGVSLPFSDFAGPLWIDRSYMAGVYQAMLELGRKRGWKHLEIRDHVLSSVDHAGCSNRYVSHRLDLRAGPDAVEAGFSPALRRAIRKAERSGLEIGVERSAEAMKSFYHLHGLTRRRHGLPPQPFAFFASIGRNLIEKGLGEIVLARFRGTPIAAAVFLRSCRQALYKFGASDSRYWHLRPNQLVMWTAIRQFSQTGHDFLHFGRTSVHDGGLARFKLSWGCHAEPLRYFRHVFHAAAWLPAASPRPEGYPWVFGHLPLALNRLAGRLIYPHLD